MPQYHLSLIESENYFFTVVTYNRLPILTRDEARGLLHSAWVEACRRSPFEMVAVCLLHEHIYCIWSLPEGDADYSRRWSEIKRFFWIVSITIP
jgi:putative transposase